MTRRWMFSRLVSYCVRLVLDGFDYMLPILTLCSLQIIARVKADPEELPRTSVSGLLL